MTTRSGPFRAWSAQAWRCVLHATQVIAGFDLTGQSIGWGPPPYPVVPVWWAHSTHWVEESRAVLPEVTQQAVTKPPRRFTPAEWARLRVLRDRYQANRPPFTAREVAHLHFVRCRIRRAASSAMATIGRATLHCH
jgi:hypothetical protein